MWTGDKSAPVKKVGLPKKLAYVVGAPAGAAGAGTEAMGKLRHP